MKANASDSSTESGEMTSASSHRHSLSRYSKRLCVQCRTYQPKDNLHSITVSSDHQWSVNQEPALHGRSAYCCKSNNCLGQALRQRRFARSLKRGIPDGIVEDLNQIAQLVSAP